MRRKILAWILLLAVLAMDTVPAATPGDGGARGEWDWTWITADGLALGGGGLDADDVAYIHDQGFRAILNYRAEFDNDRARMDALGIDYLYLPASHPESTTMPIEDVVTAVEWIDARLAEGKPVYVHCTAGWHRSLVGVAAFLMARHGWSAEEAYEHVKRLRPGVEFREADALYRFEAALRGRERLDVDLRADRFFLAPGDEVRVGVLVTHDGDPVVGATVEYEAEYRGIRETATTGRDGTVLFAFAAADEPFVQYVSAVARREGFVPGYDRHHFMVREAKPAHHVTDLRVDAPEAPVPPGAQIDIPFVVREGGKTTSARVTVTGWCETHHRAYTGWDGKGTARLVVPETPGRYPLQFRVHHFESEPLVREVVLVVGEGGEAPVCRHDPPEPLGLVLAGAWPDPGNPQAVVGDPPASGVKAAVPLGAGALPALAAGALLLRRRRQPSTGS